MTQPLYALLMILIMMLANFTNPVMAKEKPPQNFVYLDDPRIVVVLAYAGQDNFIGRPIAGYEGNRVLTTLKAARALRAVQDALDGYDKGYHLKIFDAYRPQQAIQDFKQWVADPVDQKNKAQYYPDLSKEDLCKLGYIAGSYSTHSRGSTFDLTIVVRDASGNEQALDMGTSFDFFDSASHTHATGISEQARKNRLFLLSVMEKHGFEHYEKEWWHFTLIDEPYPRRYFDFVIRDDYSLDEIS
ncbi:MAG: M15 family metallopeptidase [Gammaproteobacteria bacterium]